MFKLQGQNKNEAKSMYVYLLRQINGYTHSQIADIINARSSGVISLCLHRFKLDRLNDSELDERAEVYKANLLIYVKS